MYSIQEITADMHQLELFHQHTLPSDIQVHIRYQF